MRRVALAGLAALGLLTAPALVGCGDKEKAKIPEKTIELPKQGPSPAGTPRGAPPGGKGASAQ